jgi:hypothetical protein
MVAKKLPKIEWLDVPDIDPECTLKELALWVLKCLDEGEKNFGKHSEWADLKSSMFEAAVEMSAVEGRMLGASQAFASLANTDAHYCRYIERRIAEVSLMYEEFRLEWIELVSQRLLQATRMFRELPHRGRAVKLLPDYNNPKAKKDWVEFDIAVQMFEAKKNTGQMTGLTKLIEEAEASGKLDKNRDYEQNIKRLVNTMWANKDIYLPPTIQTLRLKASEGVAKAKDFMTLLG